MALPEDQQVVQALAAHCLHEAFGEGVGFRGANRGADDAHAAEYLRHYNEERPHRGLALETPVPGAAARNRGEGAVVRVDRLGGLIHEYHRTAA